MTEPPVPPSPGDSASPPPPPPPSAPPPPPSSGGQPSQNRGLMIVLSYLWLLALIPLLVEKDDREVQWHAKHGLVLFAVEIVLWIGLFILGIVLAFVGDIVGCFTTVLSFVAWIGILILHIMCIVKGVNGGRMIVPGVSQYADRF
ncbi:MAG: hypothetical protein AAF481_08465 [Acidobacteriota bacterium]